MSHTGPDANKHIADLAAIVERYAVQKSDQLGDTPYYVLDRRNGSVIRRLADAETAREIACQMTAVDMLATLRRSGWRPFGMADVTVPAELLRVVADALDIAADWHVPEVQCNPPREWGLESYDEDAEDGWCATRELARHVRKLVPTA